MRISWESREKLMRPLHSHENLVRKFQPRENLMRISWEFSASINLHIQSFHEKTPNYAHENLVTFSWDSHEKAFQFSREKRLTRISWETHEKSHEKLMKARKSHEKTFQFSRENENLVRFSWDLVKSSWDSHENRWQFSFSHENLMRFSWVLMRIFVRVVTSLLFFLLKIEDLENSKSFCSKGWLFTPNNNCSAASYSLFSSKLFTV